MMYLFSLYAYCHIIMTLKTMIWPSHVCTLDKPLVVFLRALLVDSLNGGFFTRVFFCSRSVGLIKKNVSNGIRWPFRPHFEWLYLSLGLIEAKIWHQNDFTTFWAHPCVCTVVLCITFCMSVCHLTKIQTRQKVTRPKIKLDQSSGETVKCILNRWYFFHEMYPYCPLSNAY